MIFHLKWWYLNTYWYPVISMNLPKWNDIIMSFHFCQKKWNDGFQMSPNRQNWEGGHLHHPCHHPIPTSGHSRRRQRDMTLPAACPLARQCSCPIPADRTVPPFPSPVSWLVLSRWLPSSTEARAAPRWPSRSASPIRGGTSLATASTLEEGGWPTSSSPASMDIEL
jgi:hypothetical protein